MDSDEIERLYKIAQPYLQSNETQVCNTTSCPRCGPHSFLSWCYKNADYICTSCGLVVWERMDEQLLARSLHWVQPGNYKRVHHFHERISQLLIHETHIPNEDFKKIVVEFRVQTPKNTATSTKQISDKYSDL